ncbi:MAG: hypothetical protein LQ338_008008 [Usnochroma carphineum]|nr:MAG: hypothetical protein LQ338_008008 [Usnochroma carphineum]
MRNFDIVGIAAWLVGSTFAIPWTEPLPTPQGLLADGGVSPRPTAAPGSNGIPKELLKRQQNVAFPPPDSWCGFIEGDYDCESNDKIRKCSDAAFPYCGTYSFPTGTFLYNCEATVNLGPSSVEQLADFYITAISRSVSLTNAAAAEGSATSSTSIPHFTSSSPSSSDGGGGLSEVAIRGIAIGVSLGFCAIFILLAIFIVRRRRANRIKRASQPNLPPAYAPNAPMQQQNPQAYQPVPQQDQSYRPTQSGYFAPSTPGKDGVTVTTQPSLSPGLGAHQEQRYSTANTSLLSPNSTGQGQGSIAGRDSDYKHNGPTSPTITEVDGSDRPLPEADSIQRPLSTHTGMVSPMQAGSSTGSPPPPNGHFMQQYGNQGQGQQPGQGQVHNVYVAPLPGTHEVAPNQPYLGPYEMPNERH